MSRVTAVVCTIMHSGSHVAWEAYSSAYEHFHCNPKHLARLRGSRWKQHGHLVTTFRDPRRVAASWLNRDVMLKSNANRAAASFMDQWRMWIEEVAPRAHRVMQMGARGRLNSFDDTYNVHERLDRFDDTWCPDEVFEVVEMLKGSPWSP